MATITSHTLNSVDGTHAGGVAVSCTNTDTGVTLFSTRMDDAGRLKEQVSSSDLQPDHRYELTFYLNQYWADKGIEAAFCISHPMATLSGRQCRKSNGRRIEYVSPYQADPLHRPS